MSKPRVIVLSVIRQRLSVTEAAARFGVSRQWAQVLLARYRDGGLDAVEPRSHRPHTNPRQTSPELAARIVALTPRPHRTRLGRRPADDRGPTVRRGPTCALDPRPASRLFDYSQLFAEVRIACCVKDSGRISNGANNRE
jgi:hypothetical protein